MIVEEELFAYLYENEEKLIRYGFHKEGDTYILNQKLDEEFRAEIYVSHHHVSGKVIDLFTEEEFIQVHLPGQKGSYVAKISDEYLALLEDVAGNCFDPVPFVSPQANRITQMIREE